MHLLYAPQKIFKKITQIYGLFFNLKTFLMIFLFYRFKFYKCNIFAGDSLV